MNCSKRFMAATAIAGATLLQGCATTMGLPEYRSVDAGTRTQNTQADPTGIRYHQTGEPVAVNYRACQALTREINNTNSGNATNRSINQAAGAVGASIRRGAKTGDTLIGALGGIGVSMLGDQATRAINTPRIRQLEADCNQENAYKDWQNANKVNERAYQQESRRLQPDITQCTRQEIRKGVEPRIARGNCEAAFKP